MNTRNEGTHPRSSPGIGLSQVEEFELPKLGSGGHMSGNGPETEMSRK